MSHYLNWTIADNRILLELPQEFDFQMNLNHLSKRSGDYLYDVQDQAITRLIQLNNQKILFQITTDNNTHLIIQFLLNSMPKSKDKINEVIRFIIDWFDLSRNLTPFYNLALEDPLLNKVASNQFGLRQIGIPDLFEALCWAVIGQQINIKFATTLKRQFIESFGKSVTYNGIHYWTFPSYQKIATLKKERMSHLRMTERKKECIIDIAQTMTDGKLSKEMLMQLNDPHKVEQKLTKIRGIGPWTAQSVMMNCLRFPTIFPVNDVGLKNAIQQIIKLKHRPANQEVIKLFKRWKNWEGYVAFYLWETLY